MPRRLESEASAAQVGARIRELRIERKISIADLAAATGLLKTQLLRIEAGLNMITAEMITRFAKSLDVRDFELLTFPAESELARTAALIRKLPPAELKKLQRALTKTVQSAVRAQPAQERTASRRRLGTTAK